MNTTTRRVAIYLSAGLLLAAMVGFATWASSTPGQGNRAGFTAGAADSGARSTSASTAAGSRTSESSRQETRASRSASARSTASEPGSAATAATTRSNTRAQSAAGAAGAAGNGDDVNVMPSQAGNAPAGYDVASDPYMPPHAVVNDAPTASQTPSRVYRPTNVVAEPEDSSATITSAEQATGSGSETDTAKPQQPKPVQPQIDQPESGRQKPEKPTKPQPGQSLPPQQEDSRDGNAEANSASPVTPVGDPTPTADRGEAPETKPRSELGASLQAPADETAREVVDRYIERATEKPTP